MRSLGWLAASVFAVIVVAGVASPAEAAPAYPQAHGRCVDQTGVLGRDLCAKVTTVLLRDEKSTSDEVAVAVVPTTGDSTIEAWSTGLFNAWGVGKKGTDNGVLLVVALDDRQVRLETGRGAENRIGHGDAVTIVDDVTSHFAEDEYALGILTGLDDVRRQLGHTVPAGARLVPLAATAPDLPTIDDTDAAADGSEFIAPDDLATGEDDSAPVVPIAIGGLALVALVAAAIGRSSSGSSGSSGLRRSSLAHRDPTPMATWTAGSTDSTTTSSSSGFGGGSSDGGGATGSW